jgi:hypothetical protein
VIDALVDEELSIGDYVLTGGELAALVVIDAAARLLPGVLGDEESAYRDSFGDGLLDHPHYTRPAEFLGRKVPDVLLSGNHADIDRWRRREELRATLVKRPDLLATAELTEEDRKILEELKELKRVKCKLQKAKGEVLFNLQFEHLHFVQFVMALDLREDYHEHHTVVGKGAVERRNSELPRG